MLKKTLLAAVSGTVLSLALAVGAQEREVVIQMGPPPPPPTETVPPVPTEHPDWAWHDGYHRWNGTAYEWVPGTYVEPPYKGAKWVPGHWDHRHGGYVWVEGHWKK